MDWKCEGGKIQLNLLGIVKITFRKDNPSNHYKSQNSNLKSQRTSKNAPIRSSIELALSACIFVCVLYFVLWSTMMGAAAAGQAETWESKAHQARKQQRQHRNSFEFTALKVQKIEIWQISALVYKKYILPEMHACYLWKIWLITKQLGLRQNPSNPSRKGIILESVFHCVLFGEYY